MVLIPDELAGFEEAWKGSAKGHLPGREDGFHMHGNAGKCCLHFSLFLCLLQMVIISTKQKMTISQNSFLETLSYLLHILDQGQSASTRLALEGYLSYNE